MARKLMNILFWKKDIKPPVVIKAMKKEMTEFETARMDRDGIPIQMEILVVPNLEWVTWYKQDLCQQIKESGLTNAEFANRMIWIADSLRKVDD